MAKSSVCLTKNQKKVCENVGLKIKLDVQIQIMESEYKEIIELFELFDYFSEERFHNYTSCFNVKLKETKRDLKNTENRLAYNMVRC